MTRRTFLQSGLISGAVWSSGWPRLALAAVAEPEASPTGDLQRAIEKHRQADGLITVSGGGKPLAGVRISLEQVAHEFLFGSNCFQFGRIDNAELEDRYRQQFAALFNFCTLGFYWAGYEARRGAPSYDYTDKAVEWALAHGLRCKGHPLVWDHPASSPQWLPKDHAEVATLSDARVRDIISRYRGRIDTWDVVNEATHLPEKSVNHTAMAAWGAEIGSVEYTRRALKIARPANPSATLLVNDYRTDPKYQALLEVLRAETPPLFDVVGIQSHMHDRIWDTRTTREICDRFARLGLPLHFTEVTVLSGPRLGPGENWGATTPELEARQAEEVVRFYTELFAHPAVEAITWWDFSDYHAWQRAAAGFLRKDMSPKPVYEQLLRLVKKQWWSHEDFTTDAQGQASLRLFGGKHRLNLTLPNGEKAMRDITWQRKGRNAIQISL
jgi:GH35 family endo-1,4-beta-xylanase